MTSPRDSVPTVRLSEPGDIVNAVPVLLGFEPRESFVAVALTGPRDRMSFSLRLDLMPPESDDAVAATVAGRMRAAGADSVLLFVFSADAVVLGADGRAVLPRRHLVETTARRLSVPVRDAVLAGADRTWSYLCSDDGCCPQQGRRRDPEAPGTMALRAASALSGFAVLPSREAVVGSVAPVAGISGMSMRQALRRAVLAREAEGRAAFLAAGRALLADVVARYAEPPGRVDHDEAARLVMLAHDMRGREDLLVLCRDRTGTARLLLHDLARLAPPPVDAPVCTLLALAAYLQGEGVVTASALGRALATDPGYTLARLLDEALDRQVSPTRLRAILDEPPGAVGRPRAG